VVPGDHITALAPANAPALARVLLRLLGRGEQEAA